MNSGAVKLFLAITLLAVPLAATTLSQNPAAGSSVEVSYTSVTLKCKTMWFEPLVINDRKTLEETLDKQKSIGCVEDKRLTIDFQKYTLIALTKFADCNAMVSTRVTKNAETKEYIVTVESEYGGCRGMSPHNRAFLLEKMPADYSVRF